MKSKTIIISNESNANARGIMTIYDENDILKCKIRLYNISKLSPTCRLGIYHKGEVFTANLINRNSYYESSFAGEFDMTQDFYTAIIDTALNNQVVLSGGTYAGYFYNDNLFNTDNSNDTIIDDNQISNNQIADNIDNITECDKCKNCKYKDYFYSHNDTDCDINNNTNNKEIIIPTQNINNAHTVKSTNKLDTNDNSNQQSAHTIIDSIIPQFQYIFDNYEQNAELNNLIKNSKFVSIKDNDEEYSIGAIYDNDNLAYICYAVKCNYNTPAPDELGEYHQWLPLNADDPLSDGYYIVYQDAKDLKIVEI